TLTLRTALSRAATDSLKTSFMELVAGLSGSRERVTELQSLSLRRQNLIYRRFGGYHVGIAEKHPAAVRLFAKKRQRVARPTHRRASLQWRHSDSKMGATVGKVSGDLNFLNGCAGFDANVLQPILNAVAKASLPRIGGDPA